MNTPANIPPVIESAQRQPLLAMVPVSTFLAWCTWFTVGVAILSTTIPVLQPLALAFVLLGIAPFFPERIVMRAMPYFLGLLGISLLYIIQGLRLEKGIPHSMPKPALPYVGALIVFWGTCIFIGYRRWRMARSV